MGDCKNDNEKYYDRDIYDDGVNGYIPEHNYHVEDGILAGTVAGEGDFLTQNEGQDRRMSEVGKCGTQDDGDDNYDINKHVESTNFQIKKKWTRLNFDKYTWN